MNVPSAPLGSHDLNDVAGQDLDTTIAALEGGIGTLTPSAGIRTIRVWEDTLTNADQPELHTIASLLGELREALERDDLDAATIGDLLLRLGDRTTAVATEAADARYTPNLEHLATLLTRAGRTLGADPVEGHQPEVAPDADEDAA